MISPDFNMQSASDKNSKIQKNKQIYILKRFYIGEVMKRKEQIQ